MVIETVDVPTLKQWIASDEAVVIDVREPEEYAIAHIPGSILLPLSTVTCQALPPLQGRKLVVHCRSGQRSHQACMLLLQEKELDIYNVEGGILAWIACGYPTGSGALSHN